MYRGHEHCRGAGCHWTKLDCKRTVGGWLFDHVGFLASCLSLNWPHNKQLVLYWSQCSELICGRRFGLWILLAVAWCSTKPLGIGIFDHRWHFLRGWSRDGKGGGLRWLQTLRLPSPIFAYLRLSSPSSLFTLFEKNQWKVLLQLPRLRCTIPRQACNSCQFDELAQLLQNLFPSLKMSQTYFPDLTPTKCILQAWTPCLSHRWARQGMLQNLQNGTVNIPTWAVMNEHLPGCFKKPDGKHRATWRLLWADHAIKDTHQSLSSMSKMSSVKSVKKSIQCRNVYVQNCTNIYAIYYDIWMQMYIYMDDPCRKRKYMNLLKRLDTTMMIRYDTHDTNSPNSKKHITTRSPSSMNDDHQTSQLDLLFVLTNYHSLQSSLTSILYVSVFCFIKWGKEKRDVYRVAA